MTIVKSTLAAVLLGTATLAASVPTAAAADEGAGVKVGVLSCRVEGGWGFVFGSSKDVFCSYSPTQGRVDRYTGTIDKFGVDIGYSEGSVMVWAVVAPTSDVAPGALEGEYAGASVGAAVGVGATANALIGGFDKSITLQPISVEGQAGLNVAAGIAGLTLKTAPSAR